MKAYLAKFENTSGAKGSRYLAAEDFRDACQGALRLLKDVETAYATRILSIEELGPVAMWLRKARKV